MQRLYTLFEHFVCEVVCLAFAFAFRLAIPYAYPDPTDITRMVLVFLDNVMMVGVFLWLLYQLAVKFWNERERIKTNGLHGFLAA